MKKGKYKKMVKGYGKQLMGIVKKAKKPYNKISKMGMRALKSL